MYQIFIKNRTSAVWTPYFQPYPSKDMANAMVENLILDDELSGQGGLYVYKVEEV